MKTNPQAVTRHCIEQVRSSLRESGKVAVAIIRAARRSAARIPEAAAIRCHQLLLDKLTKLKRGDQLSVNELRSLAGAMKQAIGTRREIVRFLAEKFDQEMVRQQRKNRDGRLSPDQVANARKRIFGC